MGRVAGQRVQYMLDIREGSGRQICLIDFGAKRRCSRRGGSIVFFSHEDTADKRQEIAMICVPWIEQRRGAIL